MNVIKGLILKDILQLKSYLKNIFFYIIIFLVTCLSYTTDNGTINPIILVLITLVFGMIAIASFSYDQTSKSDKYILSLPVTKKEVVKSKYFLTVLATLAGTIIGSIINLIVSLAMYKALPNFYELFTVALSGTLGIAFIHAIQLPCIYKFGAEKGRIISTLIAMIIASGIANILIFNIKENSIKGDLEKILPFIFLSLIFVFYYISFKISCSIYEKKEV